MAPSHVGQLTFAALKRPCATRAWRATPSLLPARNPSLGLVERSAQADRCGRVLAYPFCGCANIRELGLARTAMRRGHRCRESVVATSRRQACALRRIDCTFYSGDLRRAGAPMAYGAPSTAVHLHSRSGSKRTRGACTLSCKKMHSVRHAHVGLPGGVARLDHAAARTRFLPTRPCLRPGGISDYAASTAASAQVA
jgi:hypothetical protein